MAEHVIKLSTEAPDVSDSEVSSLCGSELELEMAWGEGPIAPLRTEAAADDGATKKNLIAGVERSGSNGNGSSRARTPQKRGNHHFGNRAASTRLEDLMEHMDINVEWRSNFQKLAEPQNEDLQTEFRKGGGAHENNRSHAPRNRRKDGWNAEANRRLNTKIMVLKSPKKKILADDVAQISLCEFIRETRIARRQVVAVSPEKVVGNSQALELSKTSESSEGFLLVEAPQV
ncbi:hypothetical protein AM588_10004790 [Phytophthora nicotianae]|uniref:Uncharacterized protein n=1 Tax=Phytophthora nicotianae TaxID=4792 RepID=A0A0W8D6X7_PHYNI|nr:hypothetical protein AM588_10004790 [Phytophthora nicotianae]